ncbi:MAG TPA: hypothetical protein VLH38_03380 [Patescibacteria group bacterium]|nr:hypothetical protein [Patescibacteria group bacterium]
MKEFFNKEYWIAVISGAKQLTEAVSLIIVSGVAIYYTKRSVEGQFYQHVFMAAEGVVVLRGGWEFMRHLAHKENKTTKG